MNGAEEVLGGFVVAGCDGPELLKLGKEVFDQVARFVEVSVVVSGDLTVGLGWDDRRLARCGKKLNHPRVGVKRFVGDQRVSVHVWEQMVSPNQVMSLAPSQEEAGGIAQRINDGVDLGAQPSSGASDCLILSDFFWAPALCW